jgi:hypothetical protein
MSRGADQHEASVGRRRYVFDEAKTQRYLAEGRGTGEGATYQPWLKINDVPSIGRSHRPWSPKTQRKHHLLSDGEWKTFLQFESQEDVCDIWEQFPMDRFQTFKIALELGYRPALTLDGTSYVLTLDFIVIRRLANRRTLSAYSFKYCPETLPERQKQLHHIAAVFLDRAGVSFELVDETAFNDDFIRNYDSVRACHDLSNQVGYDPPLVHALGATLVSKIAAGANGTLLSGCHEISKECSVSAEAVFTVAKHLLARRVLLTDLGTRLDLAEFPLADIHISRVQP